MKSQIESHKIVTMCKRTQMQHKGPPRIPLIQQVNLFFSSRTKKSNRRQVNCEWLKKRKQVKSAT